MNACPKCGGTTGYLKVQRVTGTITDSVSWDGKDIERCGGEDGLTYHEPKTVRCEDCDARFPNPDR
jgi:hypothetical protein